MSTIAHIVVFAGDGIGPEVATQARRVLDVVVPGFTYTDLKLGGCAIDTYGIPLRNEDVELARDADAVLLGAVGGPKWDDPKASIRPEQGILKIRKELGLFANLRPVKASPFLADASPLKNHIIDGTDIVVVRELTGGLYFGQPSKQWDENGERVAVDTMIYREHEIERVARIAFEFAGQRRGRVTSIDKANVLSSSRLWRQVVSEVAADYPRIALDHMLVDSASMKLIQSPTQFDVIVTENMFGDILTDEASVLGGSLGLLASASVGAGREGRNRLGLFEPIHGTAPDIAGKGIANPAGMMLSAALMLRMSFGLETEASAIENAIDETLAAGTRTGDLGGTAGTRVHAEPDRPLDLEWGIRLVHPHSHDLDLGDLKRTESCFAIWRQQLDHFGRRLRIRVMGNRRER
jgi:3-isopropylmalate dehydrogenase